MEGLRKSVVFFDRRRYLEAEARLFDAQSALSEEFDQYVSDHFVGSSRTVKNLKRVRELLISIEGDLSDLAWEMETHRLE